MWENPPNIFHIIFLMYKCAFSQLQWEVTKALQAFINGAKSQLLKKTNLILTFLINKTASQAAMPDFNFLC